MISKPLHVTCLSKMTQQSHTTDHTLCWDPHGLKAFTKVIRKLELTYFSVLKNYYLSTRTVTSSKGSHETVPYYSFNSLVGKGSQMLTKAFQPSYTLFC